MAAHTHKENLFTALNHETPQVVPWVPFAGVHAGALTGASAREVLTDGEILLQALLEVNRQYDPDGQPVMFDLQVEAEILGCELIWDDKAPPSVVSHPLASDAVIPHELPEKHQGRLPMILDTMRKMKGDVGDSTGLYGLTTGPLTLASHLRGTEIFMDMFDKPDYLAELLKYCADVALHVAAFYREAGMDVIAVVDPVVSQISPKHFTQFLSADFTRVFSAIKDLGAHSAFFVCGDATKNIEVMCETGPDSIAVDENIDLLAAKQITDLYNITIQGNIPLTTHMLLGNQQDNMEYVMRLFDAIGGASAKNLIISPGCDMPYDIPPENVIGTMQAIREPETARAMLANYQSEEIDLSTVQLPDYEALEKPLMEIFTLDSSTCPACGYMLSAAQRAYDDLNGAVDMVEYRITEKDNIARMKKHGVKNLPSILINGELKFSSIIPSNRELIETLQTFL